ncbi:unnamed protein product [Urochloa humidicola]
MARNAAPKEEGKVLALEVESRPIGYVDGRDELVESQAFHEVMACLQARGDGIEAAFFDSNLVMDVQACGEAVKGKAADAAAVTNKVSEDGQKTVILELEVMEPVQVHGGAVSAKMGNAAAVTDKASEDEHKSTILDPKPVDACGSKRQVTVVKARPKKQVVAKKGKDKKGNQKEVVIYEKAILEDDKDIPEPIATLNFKNLLESYEECVKGIANKVKEESSQKFCFVEDGKEWCVPVTLGPDNSPKGAYVIKLTDGEGTLLLVAQKFQTWFRGIVTRNSDKFEIKGMEPRMMGSSKPLHTSSRYCDLLGGDTVAVCRIGFGPLIKSFRILAEHVGQNKDYEEAIAVLLVMLFEAPRFPAVFEKSMKLLIEGEEDTVGEELKKLINNWCDISRDFYMANGEETRIILTDQTSEIIRKVATGFSLLCGSKWIQWQEANIKKKGQNQHLNTKVRK